MSSSPDPQVPLHEPTNLIVLDTNITLDLFLFNDPRTANLREQLTTKKLTWIATAHMRNELERVLTYPHIAAKMAFYEKTADDILRAFDQSAHITADAIPKAPYTCKDADDQVFIDLACHLASQASPGSSPSIQLISKDKAVTSMRKRLEKLSVCVSSTFSG
jgi:putative PIN family toxin of toxin-antitoxin system